MIETKVAAGSFTGILTGLITWALVAYVPAFRSGIPAPVAALIPVAVAWLAHSVAAYEAPHTHRPELATATRTTTLPGNVTITTAQKPLSEAEAAQLKQELAERIAKGGTA